MKKLLSFTTLALCFTALTLSSCGTPKKKTTTDPDISSVEQQENMGDMALELNGDSDSMKAGGLQTVYFDFNSHTLRSDTRISLDANVAFLKDNASVSVQVEGHCDERGGVQYNLALGERRAKAVREYLVSNGIAGSRITTISFGKERPITFGHDEGSWSKNRRGNFVVTAK